MLDEWSQGPRLTNISFCGDGGPESDPLELTDTGELAPLSTDLLPIDRRSGLAIPSS